MHTLLATLAFGLEPPFFPPPRPPLFAKAPAPAADAPPPWRQRLTAAPVVGPPQSALDFAPISKSKNTTLRLTPTLAPMM